MNRLAHSGAIRWWSLLSHLLLQTSAIRRTTSVFDGAQLEMQHGPSPA
jgi:hypothetical protein